MILPKLTSKNGLIYLGIGIFVCLMVGALSLGVGMIITQVKIEKQHPIDLITTTIQNIPYCSAIDTPNRLLQYDVYLPKNAKTQRLPLVVFIHGGGWVSGDKRNGIVDYYGSDLIAHNIAIASINYRLAPGSTYPTQGHDVACALQDITHRARSFGIDPDRIGLLGDSAGGLLAAMYALNQTDSMPRTRAVVEFYGTSDLMAQLTRFPQYDKDALSYLGTRNTVIAKAASPQYRIVHYDVPPFLLLQGDRDAIVHPDQTRLFYNKLASVNKQTKLVVVKGAGHYFGTKNSPNAGQIHGMVTAWFEKYLVDGQYE